MDMSTEFELGGNRYRMHKLSVRAQLHVSRKITPVIPTLVPVFMRMAKGGNFVEQITESAELLQPFADCIANMSEEDADFVFDTCLSVVARFQEQSGNWAPVWNVRAHMPMFDDVGLEVFVPLIVRVIADSIGPFIKGLLTSQRGSPQTAE